ncbi:hypothetical protein ACVQ92_08990 [Staphylococcus aureus]
MILTCYNTFNTSFAIIEFENRRISGIDEARSKNKKNV